MCRRPAGVGEVHVVSREDCSRFCGAPLEVLHYYVLAQEDVVTRSVFRNSGGTPVEWEILARDDFPPEEWLARPARSVAPTAGLARFAGSIHRAGAQACEGLPKRRGGTYRGC